MLCEVGVSEVHAAIFATSLSSASSGVYSKWLVGGGKGYTGGGGGGGPRKCDRVGNEQEGKEMRGGGHVCVGIGEWAGAGGME